MSTAISTVNDSEGMGIMVQNQMIPQEIQLAGMLLDKRIVTAKNFPRTIATFKKEVTDLITNDVETARSAEYAKPVGGSTVRGPSVRLAELMAMCWGNITVTINDPIIGDSFVTVKASVYDFQRNYEQEASATTSILYKNGGRYNNSMIETVCQATAAKAKRNAILAAIPRAYVQDFLDIAKKVAEGNQKPLEQRRIDALDFFARSYKVTSEQVFTTLRIKGMDDMTDEHIRELNAIREGIKEGTPVADFFPVATESKSDAIKAKLEARKAKPIETQTVPPVANSATTQAAVPPATKPDMLAGLMLELEKRGALSTFLEQRDLKAEEIAGMTAPQRSKLCGFANALLATLTADAGE